MEIIPDKQKIENCLGKRYQIDFYQREYVWQKKTVETLLNDIFYQFELSYEQHKDTDIDKKIIEKFNWYYLSTYITNKYDAKTYIVDGQQRLTTLTLIALKLMHLTEDNKLKNFLKKKIRDDDKYDGDIFWIDHERRKEVMNHLMENKIPADSDFKNDVTQKNIRDRYKDISEYFDTKKINDKKLKGFICYFLERLVLVELQISKDDTPMIFEVINDRGMALKPFEILKGKLLGALGKDDIEYYNQSWEESITKIKDHEDAFFTDYIKSKFMHIKDTSKENRINNEYHRYIFEKNKIAEALKFRNKDEGYKQHIKKFIDKDLKYYTELYAKIIKNELKYDYITYNKDINRISGYYQNIMAACEINDAQEEDKIKMIAKEVDRIFILLNLNDIYDSNNFKEISYNLNKELKDKTTDEYRGVFDETIKNRIKQKRSSTVKDLISYSNFKKQGYEMNTKLLRYILARIEERICKESKIDMQKNVHHLATKTTSAHNNYHIEHILANNEENKGYFENEEEFNEQRNRLGGLLLLKGKNNISSSNEPYKDKLKTYSNGLMLGRTLHKDCYHKNLDFKKWNNSLDEKFKHIDKFDKKALEHRTKVLYHLVKLIWEV